MDTSLNQGEAMNRAEALSHLRSLGYARLSAVAFTAALDLGSPELSRLRPSWSDLPPDEYLRDGGRYRSRRHSCFVQSFEPWALEETPRRPHWQPTTYNALHGGIERWFEPIAAAVREAPAWRHLLQSLGSLFAELRPVDRWYIEAHQFRIDTANGIGRPTPEGAHRDGVDFVAVIMVERLGVKGGETHVFDARGAAGTRFTLQQPWSALLMDDARVVHETTPIQPDGPGGCRDTLVLTYREAGFQSRDAAPG